MFSPSEPSAAQVEAIIKDDNHLPDGILLFPDLKQAAIEVELTMKSKKRLEDILWDYALHKHRANLFLCIQIT